MNITELMERYGLSSRQSLYDRINSLGLSLKKEERGKIDASPEQVELLDELNDHLKKGGSLKSFVPLTDSAVFADTELIESLDIMSGEQQLLEMLVGAIASNLQPRSPLSHHEELEKAAANEWLLTSKEVKDLIGVKPVCKNSDSNVFSQGSWKFTKMGKIGRSLAWLVEKV